MKLSIDRERGRIFLFFKIPSNANCMIAMSGGMLKSLINYAIYSPFYPITIQNRRRRHHHPFVPERKKPVGLIRLY